MGLAARSWLLAPLLASLAFVHCAPAADPPAVGRPPSAARILHETTLHGEKRNDPYFWLREKDNPRVRAYLKAENDYADAVMKHTADLQEKLIDECLGRIEQTDTDVPVHWGDYWYYTRTEEEEDYSIHCRKQGTLDADEEIVLNENDLAAGHGYFEMGALAMSPNQQLVAFATDTDGTERYTLKFKDLRTNKTFNEAITGASTSLAWGTDNRTIFYATLDAANRAYRVYRHTLGTEPQQDVMVHEEQDEACYILPSNSKDFEYVLLVIERNNHGAEVRYVPAATPTQPLKILRPRQPGLEYSVEHHKGKFIIVTNENALNGKLMEVSAADPKAENWKELIPHRADVKIESLDVFDNFAVMLERSGGVQRFEARNMTSGEVKTIGFDEPDYMVELADNVDFKSRQLRFKYSSLMTPESTFEYDLAKNQRELKKQKKVLGGFDRKQYVFEKIQATAADGTQIPIAVVYKKGLTLDGNNPCLLYGYGAYGISEDPYFDSTLLSLLDRGFVYAVAHPRGGGEFGRAWYEAGKLLKKKNSFTDFIACAEHLIAKKYTSSKKLAISGASAGGLLVGTVVNMRPDLCAVAIGDVPFVDVLNTMLDPSLPLTVAEYKEWGNPNEKEYYDYIKSYAPYENVKPQAYPHMLVRAGLNDTRVAYWEPVKWVALLRKVKTDQNRLVLRTNLDAGHAGASGRSGSVEELAYDYAFLIDLLAPDKE